MKEEEGEARGAYRGTAYHRVLELLDFSKISSEKETKEAIDGLVADKRLTESNRKLVHHSVIWRFLDSPFGRRMQKAAKDGRLHKEQQFVMGIPAEEMGLGDSKELILIQGIMDAYIEEEKELILVDYKTDYIEKGEEQLLVERYGLQLEYYKKALEQMTGKKVKDAVIYSLTLQEEMHLKDSRRI